MENKMNELAQRLDQYARDADNVKSHVIAKDLREAASALRSRGEAVADSIPVSDLRAQLSEYADPDCGECNGSGVWMGNVLVCNCVLDAIPERGTTATPASAWRPIAEAPRDGREMILLLTPSRIPQVAYSNTWWTAGFSVECKPTHWMPLPAPPILEQPHDAP